MREIVIRVVLEQKWIFKRFYDTFQLVAVLYFGHQRASNINTAS